MKPTISMLVFLFYVPLVNAYHWHDPKISEIDPATGEVFGHGISNPYKGYYELYIKFENYHRFPHLDDSYYHLDELGRRVRMKTFPSFDHNSGGVPYR